jgi:hypothetical protein
MALLRKLKIHKKSQKKSENSNESEVIDILVISFCRLSRHLDARI